MGRRGRGVGAGRSHGSLHRLGFVASLTAAALAAGACAPAGAGTAAPGIAGLADGADSTGTVGPGVAAGPARAYPPLDWPVFGAGPAHSGAGPPSGIHAGDLRRLRRQVIVLDGTVDSAPIALHGVTVRGHRRDVIVVTTTYGRTEALDARTGGRLWEYTPASLRALAGSAQVTNATPVADPSRAFVYAASPDGRVRKLRLRDGREVRAGGWPAAVTRDPTREKLAGALTVSGRWVVVVTGGYIGDAPTYQGHVALIDRATGDVAHVFNALCSARRRLIVPRSCGESDAAIWARAGAVVEPGSGRILVATGNGPFDGRGDWADSVLELTPDATRLLHSWTPTDQRRLEQSDTDIGSSAPALVDAGGRRLAVQGAKDGRLHLLDLDRLNGTAGGASPRLGGELDHLPTPGGAPLFSQPAVAVVRGRPTVFVADEGATGAYVVAGAPRRPRLVPIWERATGGSSPVLSDGLLYVFDIAGGALVVRDPATGAQLARLPAGPGHWNSPVAAGGRIVLPLGSYQDHATRGALVIWHAPGA